jgi:uncharacterized protein YndB with AHSA1/START domain
MIERVCGVVLLCAALSAQEKPASTVITEGVVDASIDEVWRVFSTAEGYKNLGVAQADMDFRPGGLIRTHYDPKGQLGDEGTIVAEILTYDPGHMITTRIAYPPKGFPFMTAYRTVWTVVTLTGAGSGHTHFRSAMVGFDATAESQAMRAFFERGNAAVLEELQRHYVKPAAASGAASCKLDAFAPLVGRDWTAPLPKGNLTDTQRFEWIYGKKFIRNSHAVKTAKGEVVYEGETVYAWDARAGRIVWWYWNASGGYLEGTASIGDDGTIITEGQNHGGANQLDRTRSTMRITADAWTFAPSYEKDRVWNSEPMRTYR